MGKKDSRIRIFQNKANLGPVKNWKKCFDETKGQYIKILWSDDWMSQTFIEKAIERMDDDTSFVLSWCSITDGSKTYGEYKFEKEFYNSNYYLQDILFYRKHNFPVSPGCALFHTTDVREAYIEKIPYDEGLDSSINGAGNDLLIYLVAANKHKKIAIIPEVLNYFRMYENSITVSNNIEHYYEWAKLFFLTTNSQTPSKQKNLNYWYTTNYKKGGNEVYRNLYEVTRPYKMGMKDFYYILYIFDV